MPLPLPRLPEDLTPAWLTAALAESGTLTAGSVVAVDWERVGAEFGFGGLVGRLSLRYAGARADAPASLVAKLPMIQEQSMSGFRARQERDPALLRRYFERCAREAQFYRELGAACAPRAYYARADAEEDRVVVLLEDVSRGRHGDALAGCSVDDAALVLRELAEFHARWWDERAPSGYPPIAPDPSARQERYAAVVDRFLERYGRRHPFVRDLAVALRDRLADIAAGLGERRALTHGDLHLDNLVFGDGDGRPVTVLDWQTVAIGPPAWDVALFLFRSLAAEDRAAAEPELLDQYTAQLTEHGVRSYSRQELQADCRLALLVLLAGTIVWLATLEPSELTGRERELYDASLADGRLVGALIDHDAAALLGI